jgi:hypothetical protein
LKKSTYPQSDSDAHQAKQSGLMLVGNAKTSKPR